ncbi:FG-GAP-like repeat-containing protein [Streptomyces triticagri]|nr:FG-GAP-like repeat-containing protein [Streptomyces triticagri]
MKSRKVLSALTALAALTLVSGCGDGGADAAPGPSGKDRVQAAIPGVPDGDAEQPPAGKGSKDPDDVNGDGHPDLVVPAFTSADPDAEDRQERIAVVYGSKDGLDPATRTVYGPGDLGLPDDESPDVNSRRAGISPENLTLADLDGDGFPDFITPVAGERASSGNVTGDRTVPHISWGGPQGPSPDAEATALQLPTQAGGLGIDEVERGDFDGES